MPPPDSRSPGRRRRADKLADQFAQLAEAGAGDLSIPGWPEGRLQNEVLSYADTLDARLQTQHPGVPGMRVKAHHEVDSRRSRRGLPDTLVAGPGGQLWAELKTVARHDQTTVEQREWIDTIRTGGGLAFLWTPADWESGAIQRELERIARPPSKPRRPPGPAAGPALARCGCPIDDQGRIPDHTCTTWGTPPPPAKLAA